MGIYDHAAWGVIIGLALMLVGGLMQWAYGAKRRGNGDLILSSSGAEAEATQRFHVQLAGWFRLYGIALALIGAVTALWGALTLL